MTDEQVLRRRIYTLPMQAVVHHMPPILVKWIFDNRYEYMRIVDEARDHFHAKFAPTRLIHSRIAQRINESWGDWKTSLMYNPQHAPVLMSKKGDPNKW